MNLKVFPLYQSIRDAAVISEQYNLIAYISQSYQDEAKHQFMVSSSNSNDALSCCILTCGRGDTPFNFGSAFPFF